MYRTLTSLFILLILMKVYGMIESKLSILREWHVYILLALLLIIFLLSYRKQTNYITERINSNKG